MNLIEALGFLEYILLVKQIGKCSDSEMLSLSPIIGRIFIKVSRPDIGYYYIYCFPPLGNPLQIPRPGTKAVTGR